MTFKRMYWFRTFRYYCLHCFTKVSLGGLVTLLLYLSWSPRQRKVLIERVRADEYIQTSQHQVTVNPNIFTLRQEALNQYCTGVNLTKIQPPRIIIYSKKLHLGYCPVPMVASTAIKYSMTLAEGYQIYSHKFYNMSLQQAIHSDTLKIVLRHPPVKLGTRASMLLVVRDPWQRLVSAYRKLVETNNGGKTFQAKICRNVLNINGYITFELFIECIIKMVDTGAKLPTSLESAYKTCSLCKIQYTKIVRFENLWSELSTVFRPVSNNAHFVTFLKAFSTCPVKKSERYALEPYLKTLSSYNKGRIQEIYQIDFEIFGYTFMDEVDGF